MGDGEDLLLTGIGLLEPPLGGGAGTLKGCSS